LKQIIGHPADAGAIVKEIADTQPNRFRDDESIPLGNRFQTPKIEFVIEFEYNPVEEGEWISHRVIIR